MEPHEENLMFEEIKEQVENALITLNRDIHKRLRALATKKEGRMTFVEVYEFFQTEFPELPPLVVDEKGTVNMSYAREVYRLLMVRGLARKQLEVEDAKE